MAYRVLTNSEKELLKSDSGFKQECKWSILNKASYWKGLDGSSVPGNDRIKWAKCRSYAASIQFSPQVVDPSSNTQILDRYLMYIRDVMCVDTQSVFDASVVVPYLVSSLSFETMADKWFDDAVSYSPF